MGEVRPGEDAKGVPVAKEVRDSTLGGACAAEGMELGLGCG